MKVQKGGRSRKAKGRSKIGALRWLAVCKDKGTYLGMLVLGGVGILQLVALDEIASQTQCANVPTQAGDFFFSFNEWDC